MADTVRSEEESAAALGLTPAELAAWPGKDRREPPRADRHYLVLSSLAEQLRDEITTRFAGRSDLRVLDVGCGDKPYLPLAAPFATAYRGLDVTPGPLVDDVAPADQMPYEDDAFDLVLCTQVLEHVEDPRAVIREIFRVLRPSGVALVSTHGVFLYHPDPPDSDRDYWRWTHAGLHKLFRESGEWAETRVSPNRNFVACIAYLLCQFIDEAGRRTRLDAIRRGVLSGVNSLAAVTDRRFPPNARVPRPGSLSANYLVTAVKGRP